MGQEPAPSKPEPTPTWCIACVALSALLGLALIADQAFRMSATYDEVTYLRVAAHWWRTGQQAEISRMGSPLTFWKLQQVPTLWVLDRVGRSAWVDDPIGHQAELLPWVRIGGSWTWLASLAVVVAWARRLQGPRGMAMAAALFALGPNLLAHGALATMEMPLVACSSAALLAFWLFLVSGRRRDFAASAALAGIGMSCKFTMAVVPPILALIWAVNLWTRTDEKAGSSETGRLGRIARTVVLGMLTYGAILVAADFAVTGFATIPLSSRNGMHPTLAGRFGPAITRLASKVLETPIPADWVGFFNQLRYQGEGGSSYLLGERRTTGWTLYYPIALACKVPLAFWALMIARTLMGRRDRPEAREWVLPAFAFAFLLVAILGSKRNYGVRYLLPMAVPAVVWASALAEGGRWWRRIAAVGLVGMAAAVASIHPHELTFFNRAAGGPIGGRKLLSDSNLDWGQGAKSLAKLQRERPEFRELSLFYFGDTDPGHYGVEGRRIVFDAVKTPDGLPPSLTVETPFLAVSASLQWGPWGPAGYFRELDEVAPVAFTDDSTIAIYRTSDLTRKRESSPVRKGRGPG